MLTDLAGVEMFEVERSTGTGGCDLLLIASSVTVRPELLPLTALGGGAQSVELLRHLDLLDVGEGIVPLTVQHQGHRICEGNEVSYGGVWSNIILIVCR